MEKMEEEGHCCLIKILSFAFGIMVASRVRRVCISYWTGV